MYREMALVVVCVCERRMVSCIISRRRADFFYVKLKHGASSLLRIITNVFLSLHIIWVSVVERFFNLKPSKLFHKFELMVVKLSGISDFHFC